MKRLFRRNIPSFWIVFTSLLIIGAFSHMMLGLFLPRIEEYFFRQRCEMVKRMIELTMSDLNSRHQDVLSGRITLEAAKQRFIARYRNIRYGEEEKDYYWILDKKPVLIMHPYRPDLEGEIIEEITDLDLSNILIQMVGIADSPAGEGFLKYDWQFKDDQSQIKPKVSYVSAFVPWGWIIGTGAYIDDIRDDIANLRKNFLLTIFIVLMIAILGISILTFFAIYSGKKRAQSEQEIRYSEQRFKMLFDLLPFSCVINKLNGVILEANQHHCNVTGLSREEIRGKSNYDFYSDIDSGKWKELVEELETAGYISAREIHLKTDRGPRWFIISSCLIDWHNKKACLTAAIDITERKQASQELINTAERMIAQREALAALAESEAMASGIVSSAIPELSEQVSKVLGVERVGTWIFLEESNEILNVDQYIASRNEHNSGNSLCLNNYPCYWKAIRYDTRIDASDALTDDRLREMREDWIIPNGITSLMDAGIMQEGRFSGLFSCEHTGPKRKWHADEQAFVSSMAALIGQVFANDERRHAEASLRTSEENLRATLKSIGDGVIVTDTESCITLMNHAAEMLTGWSFEESQNRKLSDIFNIINSETGKVIPDIVNKVINTRSIIKHPDHSVLISRDGTEYLVADSGAPVFSESKDVTGVVLVFRNITKEKKLQEQLNHIQKMESIGQLAGGVAHDFNNMLGGIIGAAELLKFSYEEDADPLKYVNMILESADRAASLTKKLLTFARKQPKSSSAVDVIRSLRDALSFLESTADKRINLYKDIPDQEILVIGDSSELQNTYMNILINATHAMPEGGDIYISCRTVELDESCCESTAMDIFPGSYIEIEIRDTGHGIPQKDMKRIFEPFYTTKEQGKGTGLGLSSVYGTIQQYKGAIEVSSEIGEGTSFRIFLPLAVTGIHTESLLQDQVIRGSGTVLLVDDETVMRETAGSMLKGLGYHVLSAENGKQALEIFGRKQESIDLVILDMMMPDMNGKDCFSAMKKQDPAVKVLLSSGLFPEEEVETMRKAGLSGIVHKPFRSSVLSRVIKDALKP